MPLAAALRVLMFRYVWRKRETWYVMRESCRNESAVLAKCETNDLEVPANADFVLEGYVDPTEPLRDEGPFGNHTGYYTLPEPYPVFHVTAITHRKDTVYPATIVGIPPMEDFYIGGAALTRPAATLSHRMGEARPTCSTTQRAKSPAAANSA
jgi:UbiD family decarboxylase